MRYGGVYYTYDKRMETLTNTPEDPAAAPEPEGGAAFFFGEGEEEL